VGPSETRDGDPKAAAARAASQMALPTRLRTESSAGSRAESLRPGIGGLLSVMWSGKGAGFETYKSIVGFEHWAELAAKNQSGLEDGVLPSTAPGVALNATLRPLLRGSAAFAGNIA
jgi:hypothetical protein